MMLLKLRVTQHSSDLIGASDAIIVCCTAGLAQMSCCICVHLTTHYVIQWCGALQAA